MFVTMPDGCRLAYDDSGGDGPSIILLHGMLFDRTVFVHQQAAFAPDWRVVTLDLRGHGESDRPSGDYTLDVFVDDLEILIGVLGLDRPVLVGWSMGSGAAMVFAARHPGALSAVVLVGAAAVPAPSPESQVPSQAAVDIARLVAADHTALVVGMAQGPDADNARQRLLESYGRSSPEVTANIIRHVATTDLRPLLGAITDPVHVIAGESDPMCPPGVGRDLAERTGGTFTAIPDAGHAMFLTQPDAFNAVLIELLFGH